MGKTKSGPIGAGCMLAHYRLIEQIGAGGTGTVWKALDTRLQREVALKLLRDDLAEDPQRLARFEREARVVAALNHPSIVTVYDVERSNDRPWISMELVQGRTLRELIPDRGLAFAQLLELAVPMTDAVAASHARGITHGDLKPGNVIVSDRGGVKILDFGLARCRRPEPVLAGSDSPTETLSIEGRISGTVPYMSPEQIRGEPLAPETDLFALGILLYEMATGQRPFRGRTAAEVIASVLKDQPRPPSRINPDLPRHFDRVVLRCLAKKPGDRPPGVAALRDELRALGRRVGPKRRTSIRSIGVLPFVDMSADRDQDYFCEGMADEIISAISRVEHLRVASRTSSFQFKNTALDSREIGDRLGVGCLLEGSVRKSGQRLRISVQLIDVADGYQLWAERFDRELKDVFAIQEEIARSIVEALEVTLSPRERRAIKQVATEDFEAYDYYLRGRQNFRHFRRKSIEFARQMFEQAIRTDPNYAGAYAGLADCHSYLYMFWAVSEENLAAADEASRRAVELDPELAEAHVARGVAISLTERHEEAGKEFETAIRLNPRLFEAYYFYARGYYARGKLEQAVRFFEQACAVRPEDYSAPALLGSALAGLGRKSESDDAYRRAYEMAAKHLEVHPGEARALYMGAIALGQLGESRARSLQWAERALGLDPDEPQVLYNVACVYALLGRHDEAVDCLARTIAHGGWWRTWMSNDPDLASLAGHPGFRELITTSPESA